MKGEPKKQTPPAYVTPKPVLAQTPAKESKVVANEPAKKKVAAVEKSKVEEPESKSLAKAPQGDTKEKKPVAKAEVDESEKKPTVASKGEASKTNSGAVATKEDSSIKSTSRFRRSAADRKIQGTMVAEFPKRLVIKYHSRSQRDPFATLVDETKVSNSPTQRQVPNVEGLKLVGVIEADNNKNQALFEDKQGYGYILKSGDKVQKGYVLRVESNRVYFQIFEYGWSRTIALNLEDN